jgi:KDO2-lipid IV(A) lauroyltransferase
MEPSVNKKRRQPFDAYPAPLPEVMAYISSHSTAVTSRGYRKTRWAINLLVSVFKRVSWRTAYRIGKIIGLLFYLLRIRRSVAMTNLDIVYGNTKSAAEKEAIYKASLINFGRLVVNYVRFPFVDISFWQNNCHMRNEALLQRAINQKKGVILIAGHIGMMDLAGGKIGTSGYPVFLVGKSIKHPLFNELIHRTRNAVHLGTIRHKDSIRRILKGLHRGEAIVMALDQNMKERQGMFLNWMGRPASSVRAPATVVKMTGAPVVAGYMYQKSADQFELVVTEEVIWEPYPDDPEKEMVINAQKQADAIQRIIYEHPELWFWIHRRWKRQPAGIPSPYKRKSRRKKKKKR